MNEAPVTRGEWWMDGGMKVELGARVSSASSMVVSCVCDRFVLLVIV